MAKKALHSGATNGPVVGTMLNDAKGRPLDLGGYISAIVAPLLDRDEAAKTPDMNLATSNVVIF